MSQYHFDTLIIYGDSISSVAPANYDRYAELIYKNDDTIFPEWTTKDLKSKGIIHYYNRAIGGANVTNLQNQMAGFFTEVTNKSATIGRDLLIMITIGGNDLHAGATTFNATLAAFKEKLQEIVRDANNIANKYGIKMTFLIANVYSPSGSAAPYFDIWNKAYTELAQLYSNIHIVDLYSKFINHGYLSKGSWIRADDRAHPTDARAWNKQLDPKGQGVICTDPRETGSHRIREAFWDRFQTI